MVLDFVPHYMSCVKQKHLILSQVLQHNWLLVLSTAE